MIESQLEEMHFPEISRLIQCRIFESRIYLVVYEIAKLTDYTKIAHSLGSFEF